MATPFLLGSYLTVEEYRAEPTALNTQNLIPGGNQAQQDAELAALIAKASRQVDDWAWQPLYATAGTRNDSNVRVRDGAVILHAPQDRVKQLTSFAWGMQFTTMTTVASPPVFIEENRCRVLLSGAGTVWSGALNLNQPSWGTVFVNWSYVAGWATTRLAAPAAANAATITVENPAGIVGPGTVAPTVLVLTDTDGTSKAEVVVSSVAGSVVTLAAPLPQAFNTGAGVAESEDIKKPVILAVTHYIQQRQGSGVVMSKNPQNAAKGDLGDGMAEAKLIAERFQRVSL